MVVLLLEIYILQKLETLHIEVMSLLCEIATERTRKKQKNKKYKNHGLLPQLGICS